MWMGHEHFQNLTEEDCRWRLTLMEVSISVFWLTQNWFPLGKACYEGGLTPLPRSSGPWHGFIPPCPLVTALVSAWESVWRSQAPGSPGRAGGSAFYRKTRWCLGIEQKVWALVPKARESPSTEGKEGGWWRQICSWGRGQSCPDVQ